jgi:hypothetical protein
MRADSLDAQILIERIAAAFSEVAYPGDDDLVAPSYGEEPAALTREFAGRTDWRVLESAFLDRAPDGWGTALSFFSDRALQFYLPAYLIADVRGLLECSDPASRLCILLTPQAGEQRISRIWGGGTLGSKARSCFDQFSPAQVSVIVAWLRWTRAQSDYDPTIDQALDCYWLPREAQLNSDSAIRETRGES